MTPEKKLGSFISWKIYFNTRVKVKESGVAQSCPTLCDPMDCSLPHSSVHGIFQARVLEYSHPLTSIGTESQKTHGISYHLNKITLDTSSSSLSAINLPPTYQEGRGDPVWNISIPCQPRGLRASLPAPVSTSFPLVSSLNPVPWPCPPRHCPSLLASCLWDLQALPLYFSRFLFNPKLRLNLSTTKLPKAHPAHTHLWRPPFLLLSQVARGHRAPRLCFLNCPSPLTQEDQCHVCPVSTLPSQTPPIWSPVSNLGSLSPPLSRPLARESQAHPWGGQS